MKVAVTRPKERSGETVRLIESKGWAAVIVPSIEIVPRKKPDVNLSDYDWLVLTSASGADIMHRYYGSALKEIKIAVIGPKTAELLKKNGISISLIPKKYSGEDLADELIRKGIDGKRILVARAAIGREILIEKLKAHASVDEVALYDTRQPDSKELGNFSRMLERGEISAIIFTSSQAAKNLLESVNIESLRKVKVCAIGPVTAETLRDAGVRVDVMPDEYTVEACLDALERV